MKTLLKITAVLLIIIVALLFILPLVYKSEIIRLTKIELNKSVNAQIDFADMDLSLIKSFPDFNLSIDGLYISGNDEFVNDTLVKIKTVSLSVDIFSVISDDSYIINKIKLYEPTIKVVIKENGLANYDISMPPEEVAVESTSEDSSPFNLQIKKFQIIDGTINYEDKSISALINLSGINHTLSGNLSSDNVTLNTATRIANFNFSYEGIPYASNMAISYKANIVADMKNEIYTLGKNELILNNLFIGFDGSVSYVNNDMNLVLTFASIGSDFKDILSLIPAVYAKDFEDVIAEGTFSVDGSVKGLYNDDQLPSFNFNIGVDNGMFQYPELPKSVNNIVISSNISNKGGDIDNTIIDISKFNLTLGDNPIVATTKVSTPVSDPNIKARITGSFDLSETKDFYPLSDDENLQGELIVDINIDGKLSSLENEKYEEFLAMGSIVAKDIYYNTSSLAQPVLIKNTQLNFSPGYIDLVNFNAGCGESDFSATGKISNYLSYYMNDGILKGSLITNSKYLNIDELLVKSEEEPEEEGSGQETDTSTQGETDEDTTIEIPDNVNFTMQSSFNKLIYDKLEMSEVEGKLVMANGVLDIKNLSMNAVGGTMVVNGSLSTIDIDNPVVDFNFNMKNMSIPDSYDQFALFRNYLPITQKTTGLFSANFSMSSILDKKLNPVYESMNGAGALSTKQITVSGLETLTQIASALKIDQLNTLAISDFMAQFTMEAGKLIVAPTKFNYGKINAELSGWTGLDKSIDYDMNIQIPRSELGSEANQVMEDLLSKANILGTSFSLPDMIPVMISIGGTLDDPKVETKLSSDFSGSAKDATKEIIKKELGDEASKKAQKIIDDADKQAKYLIAEATKQSKLIKDNAADAVILLETETDKQAKALIAEGKKNGFVAEMAAKEAAKHLRSESADQKDDIVAEANKRADDLIKEAKKASQILKDQAQKEADKLK